MAELKLPDLNKVNIVGRLVRDPDLRYTQGNAAICRFSIAASRKYKDRNGERKEDTTFVEVTCWNKMAEYIGDQMHKGRPVLVEGSLKSETWQDKQTGQTRSKLLLNANRVQALDWEKQGQTQNESPRSTAPTQQQERFANGDDDIPF